MRRAHSRELAAPLVDPDLATTQLLCSGALYLLFPNALHELVLVPSLEPMMEPQPVPHA